MFHLFLRRVLLYLGFFFGGLGDELQSCSHYEKLVKSAANKLTQNGKEKRAGHNKRRPQNTVFGSEILGDTFEFCIFI